MKYFIYELWERINGETEEERKLADEVWNKNSKEYNNHFLKMKSMLSESFITKYDLLDGFHDFVVQSINIVNLRSREFITMNHIEMQ